MWERQETDLQGQGWKGQLGTLISQISVSQEQKEDDSLPRTAGVFCSPHLCGQEGVSFTAWPCARSLQTSWYLVVSPFLVEVTAKQRACAREAQRRWNPEWDLDTLTPKPVLLYCRDSQPWRALKKYPPDQLIRISEGGEWKLAFCFLFIVFVFFLEPSKWF